MRYRARLPVLATAIALPLIIAACGGDSSPAQTLLFEPTSTPDRQATITALAGARQFGTPTPTPIPAGEREVVLAFAGRHAEVELRWDELQRRVDSWRGGLLSCDASALVASLRSFVSQFGSVSDDVRDVPRSASVRSLADSLAQAAELEGDALRRLRDNWRPGDVSLFEDVDSARVSSSSLRDTVEDGIADLRERAASSFQGQMDAYSSALDALNLRWDDFHRDYDQLRAEEAELTSAFTVDRLGILITKFSEVASQVRALPTFPAASRVTSVLAGAADEEELALRDLRGTFSRVEPDSEGLTGDENQVEFEILNPRLFDAFSEQLVTSNSARLQAAQLLAGLTGGASAEEQAEVDAFESRYLRLSSGWDGFHDDYDRWRATEGGCDRTEAAGTLGGFALQFGDLAADVRQLPSATFLTPLTEVLVEAAEREERAMRTLRDVWRPFDSGLYQSMDEERAAVGKLRRQVATGLRDLLERYGISEQDLSG